jgi:hypothetical protein
MNRSAFRCHAALFALAAACMALAGCSPPPRTVEVIGRVTHNGQPVEDALVVFVGNHRDDAPAHARTDADGRYRLTTFFESHDIVRGAVPDRDYTVYIEKYLNYSNVSLPKIMASLGPEASLYRYLREEAVYDMWPDGVPEGWPLDYVPIAGVPQRLLQSRDYETLNLITRLSRGIPLLPEMYMNPNTSGLTAMVERSDKPQVFDFDLVGEVPKIKLRKRPEKREADSKDVQPVSSTASAR